LPEVHNEGKILVFHNATTMRAVPLALLFFAGGLIVVLGGSCVQLNNCNGNGYCDSVNSICNCYNGWGSTTDIATYKAADCSLRESCWSEASQPLVFFSLVVACPRPLLPSPSLGPFWSSGRTSHTISCARKHQKLQNLSACRPRLRLNRARVAPPPSPSSSPCAYRYMPRRQGLGRHSHCQRHGARRRRVQQCRPL
jgi:hypothetical protein